MTSRRISSIIALFILVCGAAFANEQKAPRRPDVPYVATPEVVVDKMLELAKPAKNDVVYDLGSGDGRIVITAAKKFGSTGLGIDIDPERVKEAKENAQQAGVEKLVQFRQGDLFETDLSKATVVTLYLLPDINLKLRPKLLRELKPGTRVVSHNYHMGDWAPEKTVTVRDASTNRDHTVYFWTVPEPTK
jgi:tRNA G37 N-methylase Trm5